MVLIRRVLAACGLLYLGRLGWALATGAITVPDAAVRALVILVAVILLARWIPKALHVFADTLDGRWEGRAEEEQPAPEAA